MFFDYRLVIVILSYVFSLEGVVVGKEFIVIVVVLFFKIFVKFFFLL